MFYRPCVGSVRIKINFNSRLRMKYTFIQAISALYPTAAVQMDNPNDFSTLYIQNDVDIDKSVLEEWIFDKNVKEPIILLRKERTRLLSECDWVSLRAVSTNTPVPNEWVVYMQTLRDLPSNSDPKLDEVGKLDMASVDWPIKPTA